MYDILMATNLIIFLRINLSNVVLLNSGRGTIQTENRRRWGTQCPRVPPYFDRCFY